MALVYSAMELLPYANKYFLKIAEKSTQEKRYMIGNWIKKEINYMEFLELSESGLNSDNLWEAFDSMASFKNVA